MIGAFLFGTFEVQIGKSESVSAVDLTQVCKHTKRGGGNMLSNFHKFLLDTFALQQRVRVEDATLMSKDEARATEQTGNSSAEATILHFMTGLCAERMKINCETRPVSASGL